MSESALYDMMNCSSMTIESIELQSDFFIGWCSRLDYFSNISAYQVEVKGAFDVLLKLLSK